jgi:hypothetical protein
VQHLQTGQVKIKRVSGTTVLVVGYAPAPTTSACLYDSGAPYFSESSNGAVALVSIEIDGPDCPHAKEETTRGVPHRDWITRTRSEPALLLTGTRGAAWGRVTCAFLAPAPTRRRASVAVRRGRVVTRGGVVGRFYVTGHGVAPEAGAA